ncbi:Hypothetical_protein [Hexamita inflata]|uniref:Hypothetical_protein n=1 Tax=Hexamita inflata TaxID=28002 RepID=A0AA86UUS3_9EUKA|nr:Hypothetical protein HINF_LOCUS56384 [Hexamita inflata]
MALSGCFWYVGSKLNTQSAHFSTMIYYYRYCVDILGFGFFILYYIKFSKLRNLNVPDDKPVQNIQNAPKLVLFEMQPIEPIRHSIDTSKECTDQSRQDIMSKEVTKSSKVEVIFSQSMTE